MKEISYQKHCLGEEKVETIYFGGGTPSLCEAREIDSILKRIQSEFQIAPDAEITLEANPDDITTEKLTDWKNSGINRLSIGIQSFFDEDLLWMNRSHNARQARQGLEASLKFLPNISIDLIYGIPGMTNEKWEENIREAISYHIPHLSCYALTVEPKTTLAKMVREMKTPDIDAEKQSAQFMILIKHLAGSGYEHYEISNFAKPGYRSRHNSSYWQGKKYIGIGPAAHSFDGRARWWNVSNNAAYIKSISEGKVPAEKEWLTPVQKLNEYIMISLRTAEGIDLNRIDKDALHKLKLASQKFIDNGLMTLENERLRLTVEGKFLADGIAASLFA